MIAVADAVFYAKLLPMHVRSSDSERLGWGSPDDPLSSVLLDLRLSGTFFCNSQFAEPWALQIAERDFASFHFVAEGGCWLQAVRGAKASESVRLQPGDLALLPRSPVQVFSSTKRRTGTPIERLPIWRLGDSAATLRVGDGQSRWSVVCGGVRFEGLAATTLVNLMPEIMVLRVRDVSPIVAGALNAMMQESLAARPGSATLMTRLADIVVVHAIRAWIESEELGTGWLAALKDAQIGRTIAAVHQRPESAWSVDSMAKIANLSRSRLSQRFTELVGDPPMHYVTAVRMHRAHEQLRTEDIGIAALAARFGYESEFAFARAFKRHVGMPPGIARRRAT